MLISTGHPNSVRSFEIMGPPELTLIPGECVVVADYKGETAAAWFDQLFAEGDTENEPMMLTLVNAKDAGYLYAGIDTSKCENVDHELGMAAFDSIVNGVHELVGYVYHYGQYELNNLSPDNPGAVLGIVEKGVPTKIVVKLWKEEPGSLEESPDLRYMIRISP
ncbi:MAG: hypothetical protein M5R36_09965 [Deltaproteobacteria bacterium]|nr:hypothetical protein [Deltaproteobacteria bacterium]